MPVERCDNGFVAALRGDATAPMKQSSYLEG